jgi:hypothetical protein
VNGEAPFRISHREANMSSFLERGTEAARQERSIASLTDRTTASREEVHSLFTREFARLELDAKVRTYLQELTTSKVRAMLRATRRDATSVATSGGNETSTNDTRGTGA